MAVRPRQEPRRADLVALAQADDEAALGALLVCHTPQVRVVCWRLRVRRMDLDDYVQEGLLAMRTPIRKYDRTRGVPLWPYARPYIHGHLVSCLGAALGLTLHQARHYKRVLAARDLAAAVAGPSGREPDAEAIRSVLREQGYFAPGSLSVLAILQAAAAYTVAFDEGRDRRGVSLGSTC